MLNKDHKWFEFKLWITHNKIFLWLIEKIYNSVDIVILKTCNQHIVVDITFGANAHFHGLEQERCNSSALAMELHLPCTNPLIYYLLYHGMYDVLLQLVQEGRNSSALAMELRLSCTNPLIYYLLYHGMYDVLLQLVQQSSRKTFLATSPVGLVTDQAH